jgi:hypothetical protein
MSVLGGILARTPVDHIEDVLVRMQEIDEALPRTDGVSCFNKLYLTVTHNVIEAERAALFESPGFLRTLDVAFANLYFGALAALERGAEPPRAWQPLFCARDSRHVAPLQFALAGMNAHINRDLPLGLVEAFTRIGCEMHRPSPEANDFDRVDAILARTEAEVKTIYYDALLRTLDRGFGEVDDVCATWSVKLARASAWTNGSALWHLRHHPTLSADYLIALDRLVGFAGRGLLVPTAL